MFGLKERNATPKSEDRERDHVKTITISVILGLLVPLLVLFLLQRKQIPQVTDPLALDMAQIARNISSGQGFTTDVIRPLALARVAEYKDAKDPNGDVQRTVKPVPREKVIRLPDMVHPPLYPAVLSLALATGQSDRKVQATSVLFFLLTIPVLFLLAKGMFNVRVAQLSIVAYAFSGILAPVALTGTNTSMAVFLFTWLCYAMYRYVREANPPEDAAPNVKSVRLWAAGIGLLMAACYLTEYMLLFAFLPVALLVWMSGGKLRTASIALFLVAFAIPAGWWMARNMAVCGSPVFGLRAMEIATRSQTYPGMMIYRFADTHLTFGALLKTEGVLPSVWMKFLDGFTRVYNTLPILGQPWLAPFFIVGLFYSFRRTGVNAVRAVILAAFILVVLGNSLFAYNAMVPTVFIPVVIAFGAAFLVRMLTDARAPALVSKVISTLAVLLLVLPVLIVALIGRPSGTNQYTLETFITDATAEEVPILTDRAVDLAWSTGRPAVMLPFNEEEYKNLDRMLRTGKNERMLQAIYLSPMLLRSMGSGIEPVSWGNLYRQVYPPASQGNYGLITDGSLAGFEVFRNISPDTAKRIAGAGAVFLFREGAFPKTPVKK